MHLFGRKAEAHQDLDQYGAIKTHTQLVVHVVFQGIHHETVSVVPKVLGLIETMGVDC